MEWIKQNKYPFWALVNFTVLTLFGILMRYMQLYSLPGANYQFLLHAHSHFAFSGWMFFSIALLIVHTISAGSNISAYKNVFLLTLLSAFGMLISFTMGGYQAISITFSTLFIVVGFRFAYLVFRSRTLRIKMNEISRKLLYASLVYLCLSSIGPFALGPLGAMGFRESPVYQNAIYFYLHFQMNGFMLFAALSLFASVYLTGIINKTNRIWLYLFIFSVVPVFSIFTLWAKPPSWVWAIALAGTLLNLISWIKLCLCFNKASRKLTTLAQTALMAITLKIAFQVLICVPAIAEWGFLSRNLVIGYVHLLTLGCIMPLILDQFVHKGFFVKGRQLSIINGFFILAVAVYLTALFVQPLLALYSIAVPHYPFLLLTVSILFLIIGMLYFARLKAARFSGANTPSASVPQPVRL